MPAARIDYVCADEAMAARLRRCEVVSGGFADRELRVRFRPDPAVWPKSGGGM